MTVWQEQALGEPCLIAEECARPRYGHLTRRGSVVLTVNTGYE